MIFTSIERFRSIAMKIRVFLPIFGILMPVPFTSVRAQTAYLPINPVDLTVHPRVGEEAREAQPSKTKQAVSLSLWSLQPAEQPANTLFKLGKVNSPAIGTVNQVSDSPHPPEALATPKIGLSSDTSFPGGPEGSANTRSTGERSSGASAQNQTRQRFPNPNSPLFKDAWGLVTLQSQMHGLGSNLERNRPEFGAIPSSRKLLSASSVQPTLKRSKLQQKTSSSAVESGTLRTSLPSEKRPIN
jgi:hypothetical protein